MEDNNATDNERNTTQDSNAHEEVSMEEVISKFEEIFGDGSGTQSSPKNFQQPPTYMFQEGCWDNIWKFLFIGVGSYLIHLLFRGC